MVIDDERYLQYLEEDISLALKIIVNRRPGYNEAMGVFREQLVDCFIIWKSVYCYEHGLFIIGRDDRRRRLFVIRTVD